MAALQFHSPPDLHRNWRPRTRVGLTFSPRMSKARVTLLSSCTNSNNGSASSSNGNTGRERISPNNSGFEGPGAPAGGERRRRFTTATGGNNNGFEGRTMGHSGSIDSSAAANKQPEDTDSLWQSVFPAYMRSKEEDYEEEEEEEEYRYHRVGEEEEKKKKKKEKEMGNPIPDETRGLKRAAAAKAAAAAAKELESHVASSLISSSTTTGVPSAPPCLSASALNGGRNLQELITDDPIWAAIRAEARLEAEREPLLSSFLYASILAHPCFERSLGFVLANRLKNATLLATQLMDVFDDVLISHPSIQLAIRLDVQAVKDRDPSCTSYSCALLYLKGYHALQSYRVAHALWKRGQKVLALALQSRISEVFAVDIHPAARIGKAILLDHGTGVVIGETAVVGDRVSMLQGVTLGGTGKEAGDRHPKIGEGVLIGAGATILGNITVGRGAMVAAGSLVLKDVPNHSMVAGTPARVVGVLKEPTPALTMKHDATKDFCESVADGFLFGGAGI